MVTVTTSDWLLELTRRRSKPRGLIRTGAIVTSCELNETDLIALQSRTAAALHARCHSLQQPERSMQCADCSRGKPW
jgi:hypothetical protein